MEGGGEQSVAARLQSRRLLRKERNERWTARETKSPVTRPQNLVVEFKGTGERRQQGKERDGMATPCPNPQTHFSALKAAVLLQLKR